MHDTRPANWQRGQQFRPQQSQYAMTQIHPTAIVDPRAELGKNVVVGPFCIVEAGVVLGDGCELAAGAVVRSRTTMGCNNHIGEKAVVGGRAQHIHVHDPGGSLVIGDHNRIRENVTIHRGWENHASTTIQDHNLLMVSSHVGHDCHVGSGCVLVNHVLLGGFVSLGDGAYLGGAAAVVQHCRIGRLAMIGAVTKISQDVPPFVMVVDSRVVGLNRVGLRRKGFSTADLQQLMAAYRVIYRDGLRWTEVLERLKAEFAEGPAADFEKFLANGKRGFVQERVLPRKEKLQYVPSPASDASDLAAVEPQQPNRDAGRAA
jgi:UDP-N-acetylglucosamine acyltransferase